MIRLEEFHQECSCLAPPPPTKWVGIGGEDNCVLMTYGMHGLLYTSVPKLSRDPSEVAQILLRSLFGQSIHNSINLFLKRKRMVLSKSLILTTHASVCRPAKRTDGWTRAKC